MLRDIPATLVCTACKKSKPLKEFHFEKFKPARKRGAKKIITPQDADNPDKPRAPKLFIPKGNRIEPTRQCSRCRCKTYPPDQAAHSLYLMSLWKLMHVKIAPDDLNYEYSSRKERLTGDNLPRLRTLFAALDNPEDEAQQNAVIYTTLHLEAEEELIQLWIERNDEL